MPGREGFDFVVVRRDCYAPLGRDSHGNLTDVGTMERLTHAGRRYLLLERRTAGEVGLTIETRLFELNGDALGCETPLDTLPQTAALRPTLLLPGVVGVGLAAVRTPLRNCVDGSADAVSVYAPAVGLLHALARNEQRLEQEFANGASRVFASEDLLREDAWGRPGLRDDLFVGLPDDPANVGVTVYSPTLREGSYLARKQDLLRGCENLLGLKRGLLSEVEAVERTATEITSSQGEYSLTIQDLQEMWTNALRSALALCDALGRAYALCPGTALDPDQIVIDWGDGVLYDRTRTWQEYQAIRHPLHARHRRVARRPGAGLRRPPDADRRGRQNRGERRNARHPSGVEVPRSLHRAGRGPQPAAVRHQKPRCDRAAQAAKPSSCQSDGFLSVFQPGSTDHFRHSIGSGENPLCHHARHVRDVLCAVAAAHGIDRRTGDPDRDLPLQRV